MFEYASFVARNPVYVTTNARSQWSVRKALLKHRQENPVCEATGATTGLEVHHLIPVSVRPDLADSPLNFITLERKAHLIIGHGGNFKNYVPNVAAVCRLIEIQRTEEAPNG